MSIIAAVIAVFDFEILNYFFGEVILLRNIVMRMIIAITIKIPPIPSPIYLRFEIKLYHSIKTSSYIKKLRIRPPAITEAI